MTSDSFQIITHVWCISGNQLVNVGHNSDTVTQEKDEDDVDWYPGQQNFSFPQHGSLVVGTGQMGVFGGLFDQVHIAVAATVVGSSNFKTVVG